MNMTPDTDMGQGWQIWKNQGADPVRTREIWLDDYDTISHR